ncbi:hypothetical protein IKZ80_02485 [bacterium]|nr:hypothetical protein [bacterium]
MTMRSYICLITLLLASFAFAEETASATVANPSASKVVLDPSVQEDAKAIVDNARTAAPPQGVLESGTNVVKKTEELVPPKAAAATEKIEELAEQASSVNVAMDVAVWQKVYLESETQCVWKAESDSIVPGLLSSVQANVTVTFGPKDYLCLDYEGENAFRATSSNSLLCVFFPGSEISDKRIAGPYEYAWDDLLGIPIQGSLTNYYTGVFQDGELFRYDFVLLPEAQLKFRKRYNDYSHVAIRRHVWFDKTRQRIVKTYRRTLNGSETTFIFKVEE